MPTYIVTGANRGLGLEFVRQLTPSSTPNTVIAGVRSLTNDLTALSTLSSNTASTIHILECDTSSLSSIASFFSDAKPIMEANGNRVDVLINNAGINSVPSQTSLNLSASDLQSHISTNVVGPAELTKLFAPYLSQGSVVLNLTSGLGSCGRAIVKCASYAISKAALNMLSVHQAGNLADEGVRVVCMDPGWVKTRMGGEGALIEAEESVEGMLKVVERVREGKDGGEVGKAKFYTYDGSEVPW